MDRYRARSPPLRDRPPVRHRDDHPDVEYFGQGESYRPGGSTGEGPYRPPHRERNAEPWSAERRDDRRRDDIDSYIPPTSARATRPRSRSPSSFRRRSRSPYGKPKELYPDTRPRSPPRRYSPRREERERSLVHRRSRSPSYARTRSPEPRRTRDPSSDGRRSPKRERPLSPRPRFDRTRSPLRRPHSPAREPDRSNYRPKSRSPPRGGIKAAYSEENWRRRSPSPRASGQASSNTSRRSSPPAHQDRSSLGGSAPRSPIAQPSYRTSSPLGYGEKSRESVHTTTNRDTIVAPSGPANQRIGHDRPPPTGPAIQTHVSAHNRGNINIAPPTHPRAVAPSRYGNLQREFPNATLRGRGSLTYRAPGVRPLAQPENIPPSGPRATTFGPPRGDYGAGRGTYASYGRGDHSYTTTFRTGTANPTSSTTYPRSQRFTVTGATTTQSHLSSLEKIVPGGKKLPSGLNPDLDRRLQTLYADAEKLRSLIGEKQKIKREAINEWEVRERESARETLRSELAEQALAKLTESEEVSGGAAF